MSKRQPLYTRKKNTGTIVYKIDASGNQIITYTSINIARITERHSYRVLMRAITSNSPINNFYFALGALYQRKPSVINERDSSSFPWEGKGGLFNIDGWAKGFI